MGKRNFKKTYTLEQKTKLVKECKQLSKREIEKLFLTRSPQAYAFKESKKRVSSEYTELTFQIGNEALEKL